MLSSPGEHRAHGFLRVSFSARAGAKHPAHFRNAGERFAAVALALVEACGAEKFSARSFLDRPIAEAHDLPMSRRAEKTRPGVFQRSGRAIAEMPRHIRISP